MLGPQLTDTRRHVLFPRHQGEGGQVWFHDDVGKATFPVTKGEVGQHHFADVPAKEHITLAEPLVQRVQEVGGGDAFATIDSFDVGGTDLDVLELALLYQSFDVCDVHHLCLPFSFELCNSEINCSTSLTVFKRRTLSASSESS